MMEKEFKQFWASHYPKTLPISYLFRTDYPERWLRIHSLPESKRYAENKREEQMILERQNSLITDLLGENGECYLVTGCFGEEGERMENDFLEEMPLKAFQFKPVDDLKLYELRPEAFEAKMTFKVYLSQEIWTPGKFDPLLTAMANEELRAFFIGAKQACLIAPYDGGMDLIFKDSETRNFYKEKYKAWLSWREDGL